MATRKNLFAFFCKQPVGKYRIVRCCNIAWNTVLICSDPDTTERIDERNLSTLNKTALVGTEKLFLNPATKLLPTRLEE